MIDRNDIQMQIDAKALKLTNVLFVTDFAVNLISVLQLSSKEILVVFDAENVSITFMFKNNVIAHVNKIFNHFLLRKEIYSTTIKSHVLSLIKRSTNIQI